MPSETTPPTPPQTPLYQKVATVVGLLVGAALLLPTLGGIFLGPSELRKLKDSDRDKERRLVSLEQTVQEHDKALNGLNNKLERLEAAITNGNQRNEADMKELFKELTHLSASARMIEKSVADAVSVANSSKAAAENAVVFAEDAKKEVDKLTRPTTLVK